MKSSWRFDEDVAARFDTEARTHIPHYESVVQKCVDIASSSFRDKASAKMIDVGCATGYTMERLLAAGFEQVFGVDNSQAMIERCRVQDRVVLSDTFPKQHAPYDLVLANWTLHFIPEREPYMRDIKDALSDRGIFILTDKMTSSPFVHERYHDFKRSMGVSEQEIQRKEASLVGVLETRPLEWYIATLQKIGFRDVSVIDASYCFATLIAFK
jgi:tRNA (cmo5U34)-methyltransferase